MLVFCRPGLMSGKVKVVFKSSVDISVEVGLDGEEKKVEKPVFKTMFLGRSDLGKTYEFADEDAVLAAYPVAFKKV